MKETMRKRIKQIINTYKTTQYACEDALIRYKYRVFFKGYRGLLEEELGVKVRLAQIKRQIKQGLKTGFSKAAIWRTHGENSKK